MVVKASALGYQVPRGLANQHRAEPSRQHPSLNKVTVDSGLLSGPEELLHRLLLGDLTLC